jgi:translation initiation factor IF-3
MEIVGKIKVIGVEEQANASFKKREIVITTDEQYPQHISVEFQQAKTELLDAYHVGEEVKISINLRGREWTNPQGAVKHFNSIIGWKIERLVLVANAVQTPPVSISNKPEDDLPF